MQPLRGHETAELRSLAYHRRVAEKLSVDPGALERAAAKVRATIQNAGAEPGAVHYARGWLRLLDGPRSELVSFMLSESQEARDFRQASPFAGALSPRERWQLWREAATVASGGSPE
jgi:hypothetical protein